jgi:hypothetical protein
MDTDLEIPRAVGRQVSSHGSSRSLSEISVASGYTPGPMAPGGMVSLLCRVGAVTWLRVGAGLATESELGWPVVCADFLLRWCSSLWHCLTVLWCAVLVDRFSRVSALPDSLGAATGGAAQDVYALVCLSAIVGTMCWRVGAVGDTSRLLLE